MRTKLVNNCEFEKLNEERKKSQLYIEMCFTAEYLQRKHDLN